ncbi:MAG: hypothetical protein AAF772_15705, partial [Acidobacteriota bacterium]
RLIALVAAIVLPGAAWLALRRGDDGRGLGPLRPAAAVTIGAALWIGLLFALALVGQLRPAVLTSTAALAAAASGLVLLARRRAAAADKTGNEAETDVDPAGWRPWRFAGLLLVPLFATPFIYALTPIASWDAQVYHLRLPLHFLEMGGFADVRFSVYALWPLNGQLLYALALALDDFVLAKLLHGAAGVGVALLLLRAVTMATPPAAAPMPAAAGGLLAAGLFLGNPVVLYELRVAYVDLFVAGLFGVAALALHAALERGRDADAGADDLRKPLALAGLAMGLLGGAKINGGVSTVVLLVGFALAGGLRSAALRRAFATRCLPLALLLPLPWFARAAWETGNPVYPFLVGGPDWTAELGARFARWQRDEIGMGRALRDHLLLPWRVIVAGGEGYARFDGALGRAWLLALPLAALGMRPRASASADAAARFVRRALGLGALSFVAWATASQQMRFLIPALVPLAAAAGVSAAQLVRDAARRASAAAAAALAMVVGLAGLGVAAHAQQPLWAPAARTLAVYQRDGARLRQEDPRILGRAPVFHWIDDRLPAGAHLLLLNTNQGFFAPRPWLADSFFEASQIAAYLRGALPDDPAPGRVDVAAVELRLAALGVDHLVIENRAWDDLVYPAALTALVRDPGRARVVHRTADGRFTVVALRWANASAPQPPNPPS